MNISVIGFGCWGPNLVRNFKNIKIAMSLTLQNHKRKDMTEFMNYIQILQFQRLIK